MVSADKVLPFVLGLVGTVLLASWLAGGPAPPMEERMPQPTRQAVLAPTAERPIRETGTLTRSRPDPPDLADMRGAWPRFRGPSYDAVAASEPDLELARSWPEKGPEVLWSIAVGEGHAGAAVLKGRVYVLDYDMAARRDALRCLSLADGKEVWRFSYPVEIRRMYGMSRTVPAVTDKHVVALGPMCHLTCVDARSGELRWAYHLPSEFGGPVPSWYTGQCPLIDKDVAVVAVGGEPLMMAVECATGRIIWKTPNPKGWRTTHSSVMPMKFRGRRMYVYCASKGVVGVSAEDGSVLWQTESWRVTFANVPSPVVLDDGRLFLTGGYGAGSMMLRLVEKGGRIVPEVEFRVSEQVFGAEQHTPVLYEEHLYGVSTNGQLACLDLSGRVLWSSGRDKTFGRGSYLIADGLIYILNSSGVLTLVEATPSGYRQFAETRVRPGQESYGPMAMAGGRLILRDLTTMTCLDVRRK